MLKDFTQEKFDIVIQAGQSNSEGVSFGSVDHPYEPNSNVWHMTEMGGDTTISRACEGVLQNETQSHFGLEFAHEYVCKGNLTEGRKLLIIRAAVGATGFLDNRWGMKDDLYPRMMEMIRDALALHKENRLVAMLWHQGETDAVLHADYNGHYNNLMGLVRSVRETFGVPGLPFLAADFVHSWKAGNKEICAPVIDATRAVCKDCGNGRFIDTDGLLSNFQELNRNTLEFEDVIHFSRKSAYELGRRYYAAWADIV